MKILNFFALIVLLSIAVTPVYASPKLKPPREGMGLVIIELADANKSSGLRMTDYQVVFGHFDPKSGTYIQLSTQNGFSLIGKGPITSVPVFLDDNGQKWAVAEVPAGEAILFGLNTQYYWQIRFDKATPHFTVPDGGFVFIGTLSGSLNRDRILTAAKSGKLPHSVSQHSLIALCEEEIDFYTPPVDTSDTLNLLKQFLKNELKHEVDVSSATVNISSFSVRSTGFFSNAPIHSCAPKSSNE